MSKLNKKCLELALEVNKLLILFQKKFVYD